MLSLSLSQYALGAVSGSFAGLSLGLVGGGGSILAVPLLVYLVGVSDPHVAIGTSAVAVAINAAASLVEHARRGHVQWSCAALFAAAGVLGAALGSTLGQVVDGQKLLALFAGLMLVVAGLMLRQRSKDGSTATVRCRDNAPRLVAMGALAGTLSGFFGIGGGFLVVPGLMAATHMPILLAVGSSLVAVTAFGLTTAANYATSGLVDWPLATVFVLGGACGGMAGAQLATRCAERRGLLNGLSATTIGITGLYMLYRALTGPG
ncbi:MAG: putative membrane transporter protein [Stenotrophomonas maltophilia]|nr:MAG: putative membrane transporter protein [Stenotrophomonas maltophilia]